MSEAAAQDEQQQLEQEQQEDQEEMKQTSRADDEEGEEEEEEEEDAEAGFINNHDLIGVKGIITAQKNEIEKKKVSQGAGEFGSFGR